MDPQLENPGVGPGKWKTLACDFDTALGRLPDALAREGFGVVTQVDLQQTFKAKLGAEFGRYRILGACNPTLALVALQTDPHVGVLLPCNVVLYERPDGKVELGAIDPQTTLGANERSPALSELAVTVNSKLERVLQTMSE